MYRYVKLKKTKTHIIRKKQGTSQRPAKKTFTFKFIEDILFQKKFR